MSVKSRLEEIKKSLPENIKLVAVSKFHPDDMILEAYHAGQKIFGENRAQELISKYEALPEDIEWHFIGHLQVNKVKYIVPFISMIQSADSYSLLKEIDRQAGLFRRNIPVLLQIHIAKEEHKFGFYPEEVEELIKNGSLQNNFRNIIFSGLMGMATFTDDTEIIRSEFRFLSDFFTYLKSTYFIGNDSFRELSMGMSDDYPIAVEEGSTMVRIGSKIFGIRE